LEQEKEEVVVMAVVEKEEEEEEELEIAVTELKPAEPAKDLESKPRASTVPPEAEQKRE
jgi:hypothetical protein